MNIDLILKDLSIDKINDKTGSQISTFKIGGNLKNLIYIDDSLKLKKLLQTFYKNGISYTVLGNGSNILFPDGDIENVIIKLGSGFSYIEKLSDEKLSVGASVLMPALSNLCQKDGLSGFEFGCNLPAELGGTIFMNASFKGQKISDILESIDVCLESGEIQTFKKEDLEILPKKIKIPHNSVIVGGIFNLEKKSPSDIQNKINENKEFRIKTQPKGASAGCIFKNPSQDSPAGMLLDKVGLKGTREGGAVYSTVHANWIINEQCQATSCDVKKLIELGKEKVFKQFGIELENEIVLL